MACLNEIGLCDLGGLARENPDSNQARHQINRRSAGTAFMKSILIIIVCAGLGLAAGHFYYQYETGQGIETERKRLGERATTARFRINYWNVPHQQYLAVGGGAGVVLGALVAFMASKRKSSK